MAISSNLLSVYNRACGSVSARASIQSINENSTESNACNLFYQTTFEALGRTAKWNCLETQAPLSLVLSAPGTPTNPNGALKPYPPTPWWYSYLEPADSLLVRQLLPPPNPVASSGVPIFPVNNYVSGINGNANAQIPFKVMLGVDKMGNRTNVINTNCGGAQAIYNANQNNPALWDSLFDQAMVAALSVFICSAVTGDKAQAEMQKQSAQGMIEHARAMDGNEGSITQNREASWIQARNGETGPWSLGFNTGFLNYSAMPWPW